jgi:putative transposase
MRQRLRAVAQERRRWGCPMLYQVIRREGFWIDHKRVELSCSPWKSSHQ